MQLTNSLLHALLVACDQSYNSSPKTGQPLTFFLDSGNVDTGNNLMPKSWAPDLTGWVEDKRFDEPGTGFGAVIYKKPASNGKFDYIVALQGTRGPNIQDWQGNLTYGWEKWSTTFSQGGQDLINYLLSRGAHSSDGILSKTNQINFTGQSLGGALAQYAAYQYVDFRQSNVADKTFSKSNVSLTTFNGLGGLEGLKQNYANLTGHGFIPTLLSGVATGYYWITNDIVNRLGTGNVNGTGNEYQLNFLDKANQPYTLSAPNAHRIETGFYYGFNTFGGDFSDAKKQNINHFNIAKLAYIGTAIGNFANGNYTATPEATARLVSILAAGLALGPRGENKELVSAVLDTLWNDGTLPKKFSAMGIVNVSDQKKQLQVIKDDIPLLQNVATPLASLVSMEALNIATILSIVDTRYTANIVLSDTYTSIVSDASLILQKVKDSGGPATDNSALQAAINILNNNVGKPTQAVSFSATVFKDLLALSLAQVGTTEASVNYISDWAKSNIVKIGNIITGTQDWAGALIADFAQWAISNSKSAGEAIANFAKWLYTEASSNLAQSADYLATVEGNIVNSVKNIFQSAGNAFSDFVKKYADGTADWISNLSDTSRRQIITDFSKVFGEPGGQPGDITAPMTAQDFSSAMGYDGDLGRQAGQAIVLRSGVVTNNPFDDPNFDPSAVAVASGNVNEGQVKAFTIYLPYAADSSGQKIHLQLAGTGAAGLELLDANLNSTPLNPDGSFDLTIEAGHREISFSLLADKDITAADTLALSATLEDASQQATHQTHLEFNLNTVVGDAVTNTNVVAGVLDPSYQFSDNKAPYTLYKTDDNKNDQVNIDKGPFVVTGGLGDNVIQANGQIGLIFSGNGNSKIYANSKVDLDNAIESAKTAQGTGQQGDMIAVGNGNNTIVGGNGNDRIITGGGNDTIILGGGNDTITGGLYADGGKLAWTSAVVPDPNNPSSNILQDKNISYSPLAYQPNGTYEGNHMADGTPYGFGSMTIFGGTGNYLIETGNGSNYVDAGSGNSSVYGGMGDDTLYSGAGNTILVGGGGDDYIECETGNDAAEGDGGNNEIYGGSGQDTLYAGASGSDWATSETGNNYVEAGSGNTLMFGAGGEDTLIGGSGQDTLRAGDGTEYLEAGTGDSTLQGGAGSDTLIGGDGHDTLIAGSGDTYIEAGDGDSGIKGGAGNDTLIAGSGNDTIIAGDGNTTIQGGDGSDMITGGAGSDVIYAGDGGTVDKVTQVAAGSGNTTIYGGSGVDYLFGGSGQNTIYAGDGGTADAPTEIKGGSGYNEIHGGNGVDYIDGGQGGGVIYTGDGGTDDAPTEVLAGTGNETINGGNGSSVIFAGSGNTVIYAGDGHNEIVGGTGSTTVYGGSGNGPIFAGNGDITVYLDANNDPGTYVQAGIGNTTVYAGGGNDTIVGGIGHNTIYTGTGGTAGAPTIVQGGDGDTSVVVGSGAAVINGGKGQTTYQLSNQSGQVTINQSQGQGIIQFDGSVDASQVTSHLAFGSDGGLALVIQAGANQSIVVKDWQDSKISAVKFGNTATATLNDIYLNKKIVPTTPDVPAPGVNPNEYIEAADETNLVLSGDDDLTVVGNNLDGSITGNNGKDLIMAGNGNEVLIAGTGVDTLSGGSGQDTFVINNANDVVVAAKGAKSNNIVSSVSYTLPANVNGITLTGSDNLSATGNDLYDTITGNAGNDTLTAGNGGAMLIAGSGISTLVGGLGSDTFVVNNPGDTIISNGSIGRDSVVANFSYTLTDGLANLTLAGSGDLAGSGNSGDNVIQANSGNDTLDGGGGNDTLIGGSGQDTFVVSRSENNVVLQANGGMNTILLAQDIALGDLSATKVGQDMQLSVANSNTRILIKGYAGNESKWQLSVTGQPVPLPISGVQAAPAADLDATVAAYKNLYLAQLQGLVQATPTSFSADAYGSHFANTVLDPVVTTSSNASVVYGAAATISHSYNSTYLGSVTIDVPQIETVTSGGEQFVPIASTMVPNQGGGFGTQLPQGATPVYGENFANDGSGETAGNQVIGYDIPTGGMQEQITVITHQKIDKYQNTDTTHVQAEEMDGGDANQTIYTDGGGKIVNGGGGNDKIIDRKATGMEPILQKGFAAGDFLYGGDGDDTLAGSDAADILIGGRGNDVMDGKAGADQYVVVKGSDQGWDVINDSGRVNIGYCDCSFSSPDQYKNKIVMAPDGISDALKELLMQSLLEGGQARRLLRSDKTTILPGEGDGPLPGGGGISASLLEMASALSTLYGGPAVANGFNIGFSLDTLLVYKEIAASDPNFSYSFDDTVKQLLTGQFGTANLSQISNSALSDWFAKLSAGEGLQKFYDNGTIPKDTVVFGSGIKPSDLHFDWGTYTDANGTQRKTLNISWGDGSGIKVVMPNANDPIGYGIEQFKFDSGQTLSMTQLLAMVPPPIKAYGYVPGSGSQTVTGYDAIQFGTGVAAANVTVTRSGNDLQLAVAPSGDVLTIPGWYSNPAAMPALSATFADGTTWNAATLTGMGLDVQDTVGNQTLTGLPGFQNVLVAGKNDTLVGGSGGDTFVINAGNGVNHISAQGTGNTLQFGTGISPDGVSLGLGSLMLRLDNGGDVVHLDGFDPTNAQAFNAFQSFKFADGTVLTYQQLLAKGFDIYGTTGNETLTGTNMDNRIHAGTGDDLLIGSGANDTLYGGAGNDTLQGGSGNETLIAGSGFNTLIAGSGTTTLVAGAGTVSGGGTLTSTVTVMTGGTGHDTFVVNGNTPYVINAQPGGVNTLLTSVSAYAPANVQTLTGSGSGDLMLTAGAQTTVVNANSGNDTLADDGKDAVTLNGGTGNDVFVVNNAADIVNAQAGAVLNTVQAAVSYTAPVNVQDVILTGSAALLVTANSGNDLLIGNTGADTLTGGAGTDVVEAGSGGSTLKDASGIGALIGGAGKDNITGGTAVGFIAGGKGADTIKLGASASVVAFNVGDGADSITAGAGLSNTLSLGGGVNYSSLAFTKSGNNLVLNTGGSDSITFVNWYSGTASHDFTTLQVLEGASSTYSATSTNLLYNNKVEEFDFAKLVAAFDQARAANANLTSWNLTNALLTDRLSGSDATAMGGDLAYYYGTQRSLANMNLSAATATLQNAQFGKAAQTVDAWSGISGGVNKLH